MLSKNFAKQAFHKWIVIFEWPTAYCGSNNSANSNLYDLIKYLRIM